MVSSLQIKLISIHNRIFLEEIKDDGSKNLHHSEEAVQNEEDSFVEKEAVVEIDVPESDYGMLQFIT